MLFIISVVFVLATAFSVVSNSDVFTPGKLYLFFFFAFSVGVFFRDTQTLTQVLIFIVLCIGVATVIMEAWEPSLARPRANMAGIAPASPMQRDYTFFFWAISLPAIAAQIFMIIQFGGFEGYVRSVQLRVVEWAGFGLARVLIALLLPINLVYFAVGLRQRRTLRWWGPYAAHFVILIVIASLSGSRSSLLNLFLMQAMLYHYLRTRLSGQFAAGLAGVLVVSAMLLGVFRETIRYQEGGFSLANSGGSSLNLNQLYYGVDPIDIITRTENLPLAGGSTFLSLVTNVVPRSLWPDKPDTGGVFFTKYYAGNAWDGYSNLTPTLIGEWIINFGYAFGVIGFVLSYAVALRLLLRYRRSVGEATLSGGSDRAAVGTVIYVVTAIGLIGLMISEVTNALITLAITQLIPLLLIRWFIGTSEASYTSASLSSRFASPPRRALGR